MLTRLVVQVPDAAVPGVGPEPADLLLRHGAAHVPSPHQGGPQDDFGGGENILCLGNKDQLPQISEGGWSVFLIVST